MKAELLSAKDVVEVRAVDQVTLDFDSCSWVMDNLPLHALSNTSWPQYGTDCNAGFSMAHTGSAILVKFYITGDYFQSSVRAINTAVNKDNCVEFFISFDQDAYYNIEFNCLGVGKMAYGAKRTKRQFLPASAVRKIKVMNKLGHANGDFNWEMILYIPLEVFEFDAISSLKGLTCKGNFYKCGDDLPNPHFLSWNRIESPEPNFHLPAYFGEIVFQ